MWYGGRLYGFCPVPPFIIVFKVVPRSSTYLTSQNLSYSRTSCFILVFTVLCNFSKFCFLRITDNLYSIEHCVAKSRRFGEQLENGEKW